MTNRMNRVVIRYDEAGEMTLFVEGDVQVLTIDERAPNDRVYEFSTRVPSAEIDEIIGSDEIGSRFDGSEAARRLAEIEEGGGVSLDEVKTSLETKH